MTMRYALQDDRQEIVVTVETKPRILIIDDEKNIVEALKRLFRRDYDVDTALSGEEGLGFLKRNSYHLIICDQRMPDLSGVQFFTQAKELQPETIRILLTGYADIQSVIDAINSGEVYRYISKPWDVDELKSIITQGIETYRLRESVKKSHFELQYAFEKLKELDEAKTQFFGLVSHELRTPLTTILVYSESLLQGMAKNLTEAERFYGLIYSAASRLNEIVCDIIDYTSLQAAKLGLNSQRADLSALMTKSILNLRPKAKGKKIKIDVTFPQISAFVDQAQITKVFTKILDNALNLTPEGGHVKVSGEEKDDQIIIEVKDEGPGFGKSDIKSIDELFTPFSSKDILHHHRGLGLSLAICKGIIDLHGGKISGENIKKGFVISISLPKITSPH